MIKVIKVTQHCTPLTLARMPISSHKQMLRCAMVLALLSEPENTNFLRKEKYQCTSDLLFEWYEFK